MNRSDVVFQHGGKFICFDTYFNFDLVGGGGGGAPFVFCKKFDQNKENPWISTYRQGRPSFKNKLNSFMK